MIGLTFREQLPKVVADELDSLVTRLQRQLDAQVPLSTVIINITDISAALTLLAARVTALSTATADADLVAWMGL